MEKWVIMFGVEGYSGITCEMKIIAMRLGQGVRFYQALLKTKKKEKIRKRVFF